MSIYTLYSCCPISHRVCRSVGRSVGHAFTFSMRMAFIALAKIIIASAQVITAPAQLITAPAQLITAPAQSPATEVVVFTALLFVRRHGARICIVAKNDGNLRGRYHSVFISFSK